MTKEHFDSLFDSEGRLVDEHVLRKAIFEVGVSDPLRAEAWKFLFGVSPFASTRREREILELEQRLTFQALRARWQQLAKDHGLSIAIPDVPNTSEPVLSTPVEVSAEIEQQVAFMRIQATVAAHRHILSVDELGETIKTILKDVTRTDRDSEFYGYSDEGRDHLVELRDVLVTFAVFNRDIGYVQGMNDLLSRFQRVLNAESDIYWCFSQYICRIGFDFSPEGMKDKLETLRLLLASLDVALLTHLESCNAGGLFFCHRWLLLGFKREFNYAEAIRIFEIISSHHLELNSVEAEKRFGKEFQPVVHPRFNSPDIPAHPSTSKNTKFTFDLFIAVAMLIHKREDIFRCNDEMDVYQVVYNSEIRLTLDSVLARAESLFASYCRKSVVNCFQVDEAKMTNSKQFSLFAYFKL